MLDNRNAYRIQGGVRPDDLPMLVPNARQGLDVSLDLWVDRSEWLLLQVSIIGRVVDTDLPDAVRVLTLDDIGFFHHFPF